MITTMRKLRAAMMLHGVKQEDLARRWNKSRSYISDRLTEKQVFNICEAYDLCRLLEIPLDRLPEYFPEKPVREWRQHCEKA